MEDYYLQKLMSMPGQFEYYYLQQEWNKAKYCYDTAARVAIFLEIKQELMDRLFGSRQDENNIIQGLFNEEKVQKVFYECTVKRNMGFEDQRYQPLKK